MLAVVDCVVVTLLLIAGERLKLVGMGLETVWVCLGLVLP